ncbi:MAG: adenosine deaminase [Acidimicrobiia bacterium]
MDYTSLPKAVLHDHLDGGVRVATIIELADGAGYTQLPTMDEAELTEWFHQKQSGSLERYLKAFEHTFGVMQNQDAIRRVAYEAGVDLAADGVVYAEVRFGPTLHTFDGLTREDAIEAVLDGFGSASRDTGIVIYGIATALRHETDSEEVANAAIPFAGLGVVGFDLAGPEAGNPADDHEPACRLASEHSLGLTIHAGEADGPNSMWRALAHCGAQRIGHGTRIVDDAKVLDGELTDLGSLARRVRDHRVPLEVSITSNLHSGSFAPQIEHPFGALYRAGFNVSINTDNRLMSATTASLEYELVIEDYGLTLADLGSITSNAIEAGFGDWPTRRRLIDEVVLPAYASAASNQSATSEST